jgi:hypothetical protein
MLFAVVGSGRCGTTLLWEMLNQHPELFVIRESHWIPKLFEHAGLEAVPVDDLVSIVLRTTHVTGAQVIACDEGTLRGWFADEGAMDVASFCDRIGSAFASREGKARWADKTPDYGAYLGLLQLLWPGCRFVHLVRDGAEVALSMSRHPGYQWLAGARETWWVPASFNGYYRAVTGGPMPLGAYAALWERRVRRIRDEARRIRSGTFLEVRFERLLDRPIETLEEICRFVGLPAVGPWTARAAARVDRQRPASRCSPEVVEAMGDGPRRLMTELGYLPPSGVVP